jgi:hypothetical protein
MDRDQKKKGTGERMRANKHLALLFIFLLAICWGVGSEALGASKDIRSGSEMIGTITAPKEERKQALSQGDLIFVEIEKDLPVIKGDVLDIFQPTSLPKEETKPQWFVRAGQIIIMEIINTRLFLGIIDSSIKEIAVGDRLTFPEP